MPCALRRHVHKRRRSARKSQGALTPCSMQQSCGMLAPCSCRRPADSMMLMRAAYSLSTAALVLHVQYVVMGTPVGRGCTHRAGRLQSCTCSKQHIMCSMCCRRSNITCWMGQTGANCELPATDHSPASDCCSLLMPSQGCIVLWTADLQLSCTVVCLSAPTGHVAC